MTDRDFNIFLTLNFILIFVLLSYAMLICIRGICAEASEDVRPFTAVETRADDEQKKVNDIVNDMMGKK